MSETARVETIDAHHHLWRYAAAEYGWIDEEMQLLRRDFLLPDLKAAIATASIDGTIAVQARQTLEETHWLLDLADATDAIRGVVGWAPIAGEDFPGCMEAFDGREKLKGLRHGIQSEQDEHYILREDFNSGIRSPWPPRLQTSRYPGGSSMSGSSSSAARAASPSPATSAPTGA